MVQSILFFLLGFLCAGFLTVLVAPAVWRRAVALTRKRIEAALPLTLPEIQADKDRIRAEYAVAVRKLEVEVKRLKEKLAEQLVVLGREKENLKDLAAEGGRKDQAFADLLTEKEQVEARLAERDRQHRELADRLGALERTMVDRAAEFEKLGQMYDEASFSSSNRQIELVAREAELEKLGADLSSLRSQRKEAEKRRDEALAESKLAREAFKAEQKKSAELEKKLERQTAVLADMEDKLERREKEIARLRGQPREGERVGQPPAKDSGAERERLEARLTALLRENKRLRADLAAREAGAPDEPAGMANGSAALREDMHDLAAEVVHLAMKLDGPDSPIARALAERGAVAGGGGMMSLADRVRALQEEDRAS